MKVRRVRVYLRGKRFNYPDYVVSRSGRVFRWTDGRGTWKGRELKAVVNSYGYFCVNLYRNEKPKVLEIHKIVAGTFLGKPEEGFEVNHKSGNKTDPSLSNLEYMTRSENVKHSFDNGLKFPSWEGKLGPTKGWFGDRSPNHKYSDSFVWKIRILFYVDGFSFEEISFNLKVPLRTIGNFCLGYKRNPLKLSREQLKRKALRINNAQTKACRRS